MRGKILLPRVEGTEEKGRIREEGSGTYGSIEEKEKRGGKGGGLREGGK